MKIISIVVPYHNKGANIATLRHEPLQPCRRYTSAPVSALAACVVLAVFVQAYAGAALRGVYADGAFFATQILAHHGIDIIQPSRSMSEMIYEWPVVIAMRLGVQTAHGIALVFSVVTNVLPGLIILLCLPTLPSRQRHFFVFPAFVYFAGTLSAQFASVTEGLVATSYFWLLLCLITFGRLTILRLALIAALSLASLHLHEEMVFLGPMLVVSCALRWRHEHGRVPRVVLCVAALCALASALIGGYWVLHPQSGSEENSFVASFLRLLWIYVPGAGFNLPCIFGILAALCVLVSVVRPTWVTAAIWIFATLSIPLTLAAFWLDWLVVPSTQFFARDNAALMSAPLAALLLIAQGYSPLGTALSRGQARAIVVLLGLTVSLWHVAATNQWSAFLTQFSNVLQSRSGLIAWSAVSTPSGSRQAKVATKMLWGWTNPNLSLVAVSRTCVNSVIENPPSYIGWHPYTVSNVATMPALPGVTYTYLLPPDRQRAACHEPTGAMQTAATAAGS